MHVSFEVKTQTRRYPVYVGQDLLGEVGRHIGDITDRAFVITDEIVSKIHLDPLLNGFNDSSIEAITKILPAGESIKTLETTGVLYEFLSENLASRSDTVLALGGGVIGDLAGFVASTYKRGTCLIQVPTTLLAQVDSALGGKTAVNLPDGKNLVGTFYQPHALIADVSTLMTLSAKEFTAGLSEVIKYGVIMDPELLDILVKSKDEILSRSPDTVALIVERCLRNKARVVEQDEREEGRRREILNFGHTIGHAIEICSDHNVLHGQAVAMGMVEEARLAERMGLLESQSSEQLVSILSMFGLPTEIPSSMDVTELDEVMRQDKKVRHGQLILPVLVELGRTEIKAVESVYNLS